MSAPTRRSAEEIGRTPAGPRELPPLRPQPQVPAPDESDVVLPTGLRVIAVRRPAVPMVEVRLRIPFSDVDPRHPAIAEVLASTALSGTSQRSRVSLDDDLAGVGGELGFSVDPERLAASGHALAEGLPTLLDGISDVLTSATYPADEVERERERLAERIQVAAAQPSVIARRALQRHRYGDHPVTREMPEVSEVVQVSTDDLLAMHRRMVVPAGSVLVLVGDLDPDDAIAAVSASLAAWDTPGEAALLPPLPELHGSDLLLVDRPGAVQSQLRLSGAAIPRTDRRYPALQLANLAFGGYFSSRLVENLREDKGYTYHASSSLEFDPYGAALLVETDCASEVTAAALLEMRYELGRIAVVPPSAAELESARRYAIGSLLISMTTQAGLASTLAGLAGVGLSSAWVREHPQRLEAVTAEEAAAAAAEFLAPARFTGVVVTDAATTAGSLAALGGIRVPGGSSGS